MGAQARGPWSQEEDSKLLRLVQTNGPHNWVRISSELGTRSPKQCRERYHQNLKPSLNHEPITQEEGEMIEQLVGEMGKRWAEIARRLNCRSDNAVKNWWNGGVNRRRRLSRRGLAHSRIEHLPGRPASQFDPSLPNISIPHPRRVVQPSLISPAISDISASDSLDSTAPSLVSDRGSYMSASPSRSDVGDRSYGSSDWLEPRKLSYPFSTPEINSQRHASFGSVNHHKACMVPHPTLQKPEVLPAMPDLRPEMIIDTSPMGSEYMRLKPSPQDGQQIQLPSFKQFISPPSKPSSLPSRECSFSKQHKISSPKSAMRLANLLG
ncbi:MAG: hypothetical protein M1834_002723 [Cirrosporium novae-zelandiae]|nr:MAG: hypothetical protein M1834_002723 [Cirrosporium novae-zelandiae]